MLRWTDANALEDLHNYMLASGTDEFGSVADGSYIGQSAQNPNTDWNSWSTYWQSIESAFRDADMTLLQSEAATTMRR